MDCGNHCKTIKGITTAACLLLIGCASETAGPPVADIRPVIDTYHGVEVVDNYRWLEDSEAEDVQNWTDGQNEYSRQHLDNIPVREAISNRLHQLYDEAAPEYYSFRKQAGMLYCLKEDPSLDQAMLVSLASPHDLASERIILDPNQLDSTGRTAIDFYVISPDAKLVAVSLSRGGSEDGDVYVFDLATGEPLSDMVPKVNGPTAGGDVAWLADGSGFFYTHYPREGERPADSLRFYHQVYFHKLGTPTEEDTYVLGEEEFTVIAEIDLKTSDDFQYIIAQVENGDGGEFIQFLRDPSGEWKQITQYSDLIPDIKFAPDNSLYMLSHRDSPMGKVMHLPAGKTDLASARTVVEESEVVLYDFCAAETKLYISDVVGGPSRVRVLDRAGQFQEEMPILPVSSVRGLVWLGGDKVMFGNQSYTETSACYTYEPSEGAPLKTAMQVTSPADFSDVEVVREFATSKDGTRVPMNIMRRKGTVLDGNNPTILYGYGSYGSMQRPNYDRRSSVWLDNGGIYVRTNIRGGGEFGKEWHHAGHLTEKQNTYDDFAACAQHLIDADYTNPSRLAIRGGSAGGLMVAAVMTQHPELFRAVVCQKGVLDALRVEFDPNGAFNVTEFGTVTNPDHFKALHAYSPYHNVVNGTKYPDVLFTADENDGRVLSHHSKKTAAAVQAASPGSLILLTVTTGRGHGHGSSLTDDQATYTDVYSFLFDRLGVDFRTP